MAIPVAASDAEVMAIYFGDWHVDPDMSSIHGENWTEWEVVINARPRYPGHFQPNIPLDDMPGFGIGAKENTPESMEAKVKTARANGVTAFMFDWYWYAEKGANGQGGGFLNGAVDDGFLPIANKTDMKFSLMWANQDWVDIHPAKHGWHATGRGVPNPLPVVQPNEGIRAVNLGHNGPNMLMQFEGYMNSSVYQSAFHNIVDKYFSHPNYYKVPTKLTNGTVANCAYFAIYQMDYMVGGIGGVKLAASVMDEFRAYAESKGQCLHLVAMVAGQPQAPSPSVDLLKSMKASSTTAYCWMKILKFPEWPVNNYSELSAASTDTYGAFADHFKSEMDVKFAPVVSVGWDSSPRTLPSDQFFKSSYPWGSAFHSTPNTFRTALTIAKDYLSQYCESFSENASDVAEAWCPPLLINAWNEWSEGAYLEPDVQFKYGKLQAIKQVFGTRSGSK